MNPLKWIVGKTILNWKRPFYSKNLFLICSRYVDMWYGDNNYDRNTNGEYTLLKSLMPQAKVVVDVGANTGEYASEILKINPQVQIHAFEPDPASYEKLKNIRLIANNIALGDKEETRNLTQMDHPTHNSFYSGDEKTLSIKVNVSTLDAYCKKVRIDHIDFLKVDVEGHEYFVFKGAAETLARQAVDYVQFEFSGATCDSRVFLKDFIAFFAKYSYTLYRLRAKDIQEVIYAPDRERFTLTNYIAIKKGLPVPALNNF